MGIRARARVSIVAAAGLAALASGAACKRIEAPRLKAVGAFNRVARPAFQPPTDSLLTPAQVALFLRIRTGARGGSLGEALAAVGADPGEFAWVRARIQEALLALDADRVFAASAESYARGIAAAPRGAQGGPGSEDHRAARRGDRDARARASALYGGRAPACRRSRATRRWSRAGAGRSRRRGRDAVRAIRAFLEAEIGDGSFPGAAALVGTADAIVALDAAGAAAVEPVRRDATAETLFDLASLTKPLCVGAICREAAAVAAARRPARTVSPRVEEDAIRGHHPRAPADSRLGARRLVPALRAGRGRRGLPPHPGARWSPCRRPGSGCSTAI